MTSMNGLNATNMFIFGGSASIGVEKAGFKLDRVLELCDGMEELNAYHWHKNRPDAPIVPPSVWENPSDYLGKLRDGGEDGVDYSFANCPCSGLSRINRNAGADQPQNQHFYRLFDAYGEMRPKAFTIENAPTLTTYGVSILKDLAKNLSDKYNFTVISDQGSRHGVPMRRDRTMIFGWRRDYFDDKIPMIDPSETGSANVRSAIGDLSRDVAGSNVPNHSDLIDVQFIGEFPEILQTMVAESVSHLRATAMVKDRNPVDFEKRLGKLSLSEKQIASIMKELDKVSRGECKWDKSANLLYWDNLAPSMTSMARWIHPDGHRQLSIREMSRFMGYGDDFVFHEGGKTHIVQCLAQGVPAQFSEWASRQAAAAIIWPKNSVAAKRSDGHVMVYQNNKDGTFAKLDHDKIQSLDAMRTGHVGAMQKIHTAKLEMF